MCVCPLDSRQSNGRKLFLQCKACKAMLCKVEIKDTVEILAPCLRNRHSLTKDKQMAAKAKRREPDRAEAEEDVVGTSTDGGTLPPKRSRKESREENGESSESTLPTENISEEPEDLPPLVIETTPPVVPDEKNPRTIITGRRIIDVGHFFREIKQLQAHTGRCTYGRMEFVRENRCGLHSTFVHACISCGVQAHVTTCPNREVNDDAVLGAVAAGITRKQLSDLMQVLEVPKISKDIFEKCLKNNKSAIG